MITKVLPVAMMVQSVIAAVPYALEGDWQSAGYWLCAAGITFFKTF